MIATAFCHVFNGVLDPVNQRLFYLVFIAHEIRIQRDSIEVRPSSPLRISVMGLLTDISGMYFDIFQPRVRLIQFVIIIDPAQDSCVPFLHRTHSRYINAVQVVRDLPAPFSVFPYHPAGFLPDCVLILSGRLHGFRFFQLRKGRCLSMFSGHLVIGGILLFQLDQIILICFNRIKETITGFIRQERFELLVVNPVDGFSFVDILYHMVFSELVG